MTDWDLTPRPASHSVVGAQPADGGHRRERARQRARWRADASGRHGGGARRDPTHRRRVRHGVARRDGLPGAGAHRRRRDVPGERERRRHHVARMRRADRGREPARTGGPCHASSAYVVYVAIDEDGRPRPVPPLVAESEPTTSAGSARRSSAARPGWRHKVELERQRATPSPPATDRTRGRVGGWKRAVPSPTGRDPHDHRSRRRARADRDRRRRRRPLPPPWLAEQGIGDPSGLPHTVKILLGEPAAARGHARRRRRGRPRARRMARSRARHRVHARPRADAGLHRGARRRGPRRDAERRRPRGRRPRERQPARAGRPRDRPLACRSTCSARAEAYEANIDWEYRRNGERYALLRWAQQAFDGLRVVPPGAGICHQVNLEHLGQVVVGPRTASRSPTRSSGPTPTRR